MSNIVEKGIEIAKVGMLPIAIIVGGGLSIHAILDLDNQNQNLIQRAWQRFPSTVPSQVLTEARETVNDFHTKENELIKQGITVIDIPTITEPDSLRKAVTLIATEGDLANQRQMYIKQLQNEGAISFSRFNKRARGLIEGIGGVVVMFSSLPFFWLASRRKD